ncbi:type I restriction endonuclease subunit R [Anaerotignum sp.]|uniref:type I restriction endonuclease subunit R n=1 Tax=Anaerotignum sp. TaxID=2039241 RepID=UPI0028AB4377|nr:HsdR family type I site-specific deoxyribonuclease [Anaerotignum sp.]
MSKDDRERITQQRIVDLFCQKLKYSYIGNLSEQKNTNIIENKLRKYLIKKGYSNALSHRAIDALLKASRKSNFIEANQAVYSLLRYGASTKEHVGVHNESVKFIDWEHPFENDFYIAEEVTVVGEHTKRPDIVLYINGIAVCVLELKRSCVSVSQGIRQNLDNQGETFIRPFFTTIQLIMAGNDTEGLRYGTILTPEKFYMEWKEDKAAKDALSKEISRLTEYEDYKIDRHLIGLCQKERLFDLIYNFIVYDGGIKKTCRHNQYFGIMATRERLKENEGGIIWHSQGSGKSLTMVWLSRWIKENNPNARVLIITDRDELDDQIENKVFGTDGVGDTIHRAKNCDELIAKINQTTPSLMCSLVHKFGRKKQSDAEADDERYDKSYAAYIDKLRASLPSDFEPKGDFYVFVDECHRTQSGKLHQAMSAILPDAIFIGFTGTPLLSRKEMQKRGIKSSIEIFGRYIHTYKFNEAVADKVILDLRYEARDIPQEIPSTEKVDAWFEAKTKGLTDLAKARLKKRWGTLKEVYSSRDRLSKIVVDIIEDMEIKDRLNTGRGNAILVAASIYQACQYYKLFVDNGFNKCAIITSYSADISEIKGEATGEARDTENRFKYAVYQQMLNGKDVDTFESEVKEKFVKHPAQMRLLIVVDKLLTGFDAPSATYLYIDKSMCDHGLFQAICRVNRIEEDDKEYGYIIDYMDLFKSLEKAVTEYTSDAFDTFEKEDISGLLKTRVLESRKHFEETLESIRVLCEPVKHPHGTLEFIRYFCWQADGNLDELDANESKRLKFYQLTASLIRAYADVAADLEELGYTQREIIEIRDEVRYFQYRRDDVKLASSDYIDLKRFEADMRYLLDNYIRAGESEKISAFDDMSLIELILERGIDFTKELPEGMKKNPEAAAETIENNVRRTIVEKSGTNPLYYAKMSELLEKIIEERKKQKSDYKDYLKQIVELTRKVEKPESYTSYPDRIKKSSAMRALFDNLNDELKNEETVVALHEKVLSVKPDKWLGDKAKERVVRAGIRSILVQDNIVATIFEIVKMQQEYR